MTDMHIPVLDHELKKGAAELLLRASAGAASIA
jgi:hypothetical protein